MAKGRQKALDSSDVESPAEDDRNVKTGEGFHNAGELEAAQKYHNKQLKPKIARSGNVSFGAGAASISVKIPVGEFDDLDHAAHYFCNSRLSVTISSTDDDQKKLFKGAKAPKVNGTADSKSMSYDGTNISFTLSFKKTVIDGEHLELLAHQQLKIVVKRDGQAGDPQEAA